MPLEHINLLDYHHPECKLPNLTYKENPTSNALI